MFKAIDINETKEYVSVFDPAIDKSESNIPLYESTHDISNLTFKEGELPTIFVLKVIPYRTYIRIQDSNMMAKVDGNEHDVRVNVFAMNGDLVRYGIKEIKNTDQPILMVGGNPPSLSDASMNQIKSWGVIDELADVIRGLNEAQTAEEKN